MTRRYRNESPRVVRRPDSTMDSVSASYFRQHMFALLRQAEQTRHPVVIRHERQETSGTRTLVLVKLEYLSDL